MPPATRLLALLLTCGALAACASGPAADLENSPLERALRERAASHSGRVGLYAVRLATGEEVALRADERFPTASLVKVPIALALFRRIGDGALALEQAFEYSAERAYSTYDLSAKLEDGASVTLATLVHLMLALSDNTASLWCQELAGGGAGVNAWLSGQGLDDTRVNSRTPGREAEFDEFGWGQTTPREMTELLVRIRDRAANGEALDDELGRALSRSLWDDEGLAAVPPGVAAMSKQGALSDYRSEVVLVHAPAGDYAYCIISADQIDRRWEEDNAGNVLLRDVGRALWARWGR